MADDIGQEKNRLCGAVIFGISNVTVNCEIVINAGRCIHCGDCMYLLQLSSLLLWSRPHGGHLSHSTQLEVGKSFSCRRRILRICYRRTYTKALVDVTRTNKTFNSLRRLQCLQEHFSITLLLSKRSAVRHDLRCSFCFWKEAELGSKSEFGTFSLSLFWYNSRLGSDGHGGHLHVHQALEL